MADKARKNSLVDEVYQNIEGWITSGQLDPGDRLNIEDISKELGVSRTPVREAIGRLIQDGYVEQRHNAGPSVISFTPEQELDICQANAYIMNVVMSILRRDDGEKTLAVVLRSIYEEQKAACEAGNLARFHQASTDFHNTIISFCSNETIKKAAANIYRQLNITTLLYQTIVDNQNMGLENHEGILLAIEAGNMTRAQELMKQHNVEGTRRYLQRRAE